MKKNKHTGSSFDDFLKEEELYEEVTARALKKSSIYELEQIVSSTRGMKSRIRTETELKSTVLQIAKNVNEDFETSRHKAISYVEDGVFVLVFIDKNELSYARTRMAEYGSPFPGLISPTSSSSSAAIDVKEKTIGFFENNKIQDIYGFRFGKGAGLIIVDHFQDMKVKGASKSSPRLSFKIDFAVLYKPLDTDSNKDIVNHINSLIKKSHLRKKK